MKDMRQHPLPQEVCEPIPDGCLTWDENEDGNLMLVAEGGIPSLRRGTSPTLINVGLCIGVVAIVVSGVVLPLLTSELPEPLRLAIKEGNVQLVQNMLDDVTVKVDVNAQGDEELTALHWAAIHGNTDVADVLLKRGASVHAQSSAGTTALHLAARDGHVWTASLLLEHNALVDATDVNGWTALHWSAVYDQEDVAKFLIRARANPSLESGSEPHSTALSLAESNRHQRIVDIIKQAQETDANSITGGNAET